MKNLTPLQLSVSAIIAMIFGSLLISFSILMWLNGDFGKLPSLAAFGACGWFFAANFTDMYSKNKHETQAKDTLITEVKQTLGWNEGGIYKRIDENRELLELLRRDAPVFMANNHDWVESKLQSHDEFFCALLEQVPLETARFMDQAKHESPSGRRFPRPWPIENEADKAAAKARALEATATATAKHPKTKAWLEFTAMQLETLVTQLRSI